MKLLVAGDFCQKNRIDAIVKSGNYSALFDDVKQTIQSADYSIVNFEFPIVKDGVASHPIVKCGPNLKGSIEAVGAVKYAGFNCCTMANNHILDQGEECCVDTCSELIKEGIDIVGAGENLERAGAILYKTIGGVTIAIINCCEHEFSIASQHSAGAYPLNPISQYYQIQEARKHADYVIMLIHGGHEHYQLPDTRMQETYRFFVDVGADAVVNHHQHCYSGYEVYKDKLIFYGLGNFCFDYPNRVNLPWNEGYMVEFILEAKSDIKFRLIPYTQCNNEPGVHPLADDREFCRKISMLNEIISSRSKLEEEWKKNILRVNERMLDVFSPYYGNRIFYWLYRHRLLPAFSREKQLLKILNILECESHRDKYIAIFKDKFNIK